MVNLHIKSTYNNFVKKSDLLLVAERVLAGENQSNKDLSIIITGDEEIHQLNLKYRGIDTTTDVLSFESREFDPETNREYLGDILISGERAIEQAKQNSIDPKQEIKVLIIHGILHLLGYDHATPHEEKIMVQKQDFFLSKE